MLILKYHLSSYSLPEGYQKQAISTNLQSLFENS